MKLLESEGWVLDRTCGSHKIMIKEGKRSIPIPVHGSKDIPVGLVNKILKEAGIKK